MLSLAELVSTARLEREYILHTAKEEHIFAKLLELDKKIQHQRGQIEKKYLEREVAAIEKAEAKAKQATSQ